MDSYDVRFWDIKKLGNGGTARFRVRWAVDGREHCKSFKARPLADGFLDGPEGRGPRPAALQPPHRPARSRDDRGGDDHLVRARPRLRRGQVAEPGPGLAPVGRRGPGHRHHRPHDARSRARPSRKVLRQALFAWAFNPATRDTDPPPEIAAALDWAERASLPVADAGRHRDGAARAGRLRQDPDREGGGRVDPAAQAVGVLQRPRLRRRAGPPAVQPGRPHPVDRPRRRGRPSTGGSSSALPRPRTLLAAVGRLGKRGQHLKAFFACLYYAALRPSEAVMLRESRPAPAEDRVGADRPFGLRLPGRAGLDRRGHRPPGTRPEAPRRPRDPHHPHPARSWSGCSARTSRGTARPRTGGSSRPPGAASSRTPATTRSGPRPARRPSPPPSTGHRSAAAPTTCATPPSRCG